MKSVHFPPLQHPPAAVMRRHEESNGDVQKTGHPPLRNAVDALANTQREALLIVEKVKWVLHSETRHGDLIVARGAAQRLIRALDVLIAHEEEST